jgi:hypothetical protein
MQRGQLGIWDEIDKDAEMAKASACILYNVIVIKFML